MKSVQVYTKEDNVKELYVMHRIVLKLTFQRVSSKCDHDKLTDEKRNINQNFSKLIPGFQNSNNASEILLHHSY